MCREDIQVPRDSIYSKNLVKFLKKESYVVIASLLDFQGITLNRRFRSPESGTIKDLKQP